MESVKTIYPITFILPDTKGNKDLEVRIESGMAGELLICPKGFGQSDAVNGCGVPIVIENCDGIPTVYVFDDITDRFPKIISLLKASEEGRNGDLSKVQA